MNVDLDGLLSRLRNEPGHPGLAGLEEAVFRRIAARTQVSAGSQLRLGAVAARSEEHTSELQSLMRISYAVFCLKKKTNIQTRHKDTKSQISSEHKHNNNTNRKKH